MRTFVPSCAAVPVLIAAPAVEAAAVLMWDPSAAVWWLCLVSFLLQFVRVCEYHNPYMLFDSSDCA